MGTKTAREALPLEGHPGFNCRRLDSRLATELIARTADPADVRLREMTRDLSRFASEERLAQWRPGRRLICLQDPDASLAGLVWIARKPIPERDDYRDPDLIRHRQPAVTCAIRTYGAARGQGFLTKEFAELALETLLREWPDLSPTIWYETKAHNLAARALGRQLGFTEASGEAGGTVVGVRLPAGD